MSSIKHADEQLALPAIFFAGEPVNLEKEQSNPDAAWQFYSYAIKRSPANLSLHTHRVFFAMTHKEAVFLAGALYDLFYVLKDAGKDLRIRLLKAARPILGETETACFAQWIKTDDKKQTEYRRYAGSVLSKGLVGSDQALMIIEKTSAPVAHISPLEEARSCIEYGQLEMAQSIINDALNNVDESDNYQELQRELDTIQHCLKKNEHTAC